MRYEGQVKARQQKELADSVIAKIEKSLQDPKVLDQILKQSVTDVERMCAAIFPMDDDADELQVFSRRSNRHRI